MSSPRKAHATGATRLCGECEHPDACNQRRCEKRIFGHRTAKITLSYSHQKTCRPSPRSAGMIQGRSGTESRDAAGVVPNIGGSRFARREPADFARRQTRHVNFVANGPIFRLLRYCKRFKTHYFRSAAPMFRIVAAAIGIGSRAGGGDVMALGQKSRTGAMSEIREGMPSHRALTLRDKPRSSGCSE